MTTPLVHTLNHEQGPLAKGKEIVQEHTCLSSPSESLLEVTILAGINDVLPDNLEESLKSTENNPQGKQIVSQGHPLNPLLTEKFRNAEATRLWTRFFYQNNPGNLSLSIPENWLTSLQ